MLDDIPLICYFFEYFFYAIGPKSQHILQEMANADLSTLSFMRSAVLRLNGIDCRVIRCGYTGEDGFEVIVVEIISIRANDFPVTWAILYDFF